MHPKLKSIFFWIMIPLLLSCASCQIEATSPATTQFTSYEVKASDIPPGWASPGQAWGEDWGGQSHLVGYEITTPNNVMRLKHMISIYPDEEQAKTAYPKWEEKWFKGQYVKVTDADFVPSNPNDTYRFECVPLPSESLFSCNYLQLHKRLISFVLVDVDGKSITFAQLNTILKAVDDRLNKIELK